MLGRRRKRNRAVRRLRRPRRAPVVIAGCRVGHSDDIAPAAVYLASDDSSWGTGETQTTAGGLHG